MSRRHAAIRSVDGGFGVEDVGSKNGTFVNDHRIDEVTLLKPGDEVRFGNTRWRVESTPVPSQETRAATILPPHLQETSAAMSQPRPHAGPVGTPRIRLPPRAHRGPTGGNCC